MTQIEELKDEFYKEFTTNRYGYRDGEDEISNDVPTNQVMKDVRRVRKLKLKYIEDLKVN